MVLATLHPSLGKWALQSLEFMRYLICLCSEEENGINGPNPADLIWVILLMLTNWSSQDLEVECMRRHR